METKSLRTCSLVCEAQEGTCLFFPREGSGTLSSSLSRRISTFIVGTLVCVPLPLWVWLDRGQEVLLPWHFREHLRPGRPEFSPLPASSWMEIMGMLLCSLMLSFLISIRGITNYLDWVAITALDYCCKDLVSFSATQKYQIPLEPGTTRHSRTLCLLLLLFVETGLWSPVLLHAGLFPEGFGSTECRKIFGCGGQ